MRKLLIVVVSVAILTLVYYIVSGRKSEQPSVPGKYNPMIVTSAKFNNSSPIPSIYSCDGKSINPPITIEKIPTNTKSLILIMDDPDAPTGTFTHWLLWNIPPNISELKENSIPEKSVVGSNSAGKIGYIGPCPPSGKHRYFFRIYVLDILLNLPQGSSRDQLERAMENHVVSKGELMGTYSR